LFETQVARRPDALALTWGGESLTYRELNAQANRIARYLVTCGITRDSLVGLCIERSKSW
jgi:non-ribosomal peptide synthetase component F